MPTLLPPELRNFRALGEREAAAILGVSRGTLSNWRSLGRGPHYFRAGNRSIRYALDAVLDFRDTRAVRPGDAR